MFSHLGSQREGWNLKFRDTYHKFAKNIFFKKESVENDFSESCQIDPWNLHFYWQRGKSGISQKNRPNDLIEHFGVFKPINIFWQFRNPHWFWHFRDPPCRWWHLFNLLTFFLLWPPIQLLWPPVRKLYLPHTKIKIYPKIHQSSQKINQKVDINHFNPNIYQNDSKIVKKTNNFFSPKCPKKWKKGVNSLEKSPKTSKNVHIEQK